MFRTCVLGLLVFATLTAAERAQRRNGNGGIAVHVIDSEAQPVAGASVRVLCNAEHEPRTGVTDETGSWRTRSVPRGRAELQVRMDGFKPAKEWLSFKRRTVFTVRLAAISEVRASVTEATEVGETIRGDKLERLPLADRRSMNAVSTTGASVFLGYESGGKASFSLGGGRAQSQAFTIDGGNGQSMRMGSGHTETDLAVEELSELRVVSNGYSAEHGGSAGGILSAKIKSGSNRNSGSLFEFLRNDALDAADYFAPVSGDAKVKAPLRYNVFGGTFGGPILRDRAFFFTSYEGARRIEGNTRVMTVPTAMERAGNFAGSVNSQGRPINIFDPFSTRAMNGRVVRDPFPGNVIPSSRIDVVARKLLVFYPEGNTVPLGLSNANNFTGNSGQEFVRDHLTLKGDYVLTAADRVSGRYGYDVNDQQVRSVYPNPAAENQTNNLNDTHIAFASWTRTSATRGNDMRFTWSRRNTHQVSNGLGGGWPTKLGLTGVPDAAFPRFQASGYAPIGAANQERIQLPVRQWQILDILTLRRTTHNMRFGFEIRPSRNVERDLATQSGSFTFNPQGTGQPGQSGSGNSFASLLMGVPYSFAQRLPETLDRSSRYAAAFVQDDWQVAPSLSLNFGIRWEVDTAMHDANHRMNGFDAGAINPVSGTPGVVRFAGLDGWPDTLYRTDWNNIGPRFGFAWRLPGARRTILRGGYGVFFGHPFDRGVTAAASLGYELSARLISPDNGATAPFILAQGVPVSPEAPVLNSSFGAAPPGQPATTSVGFFDPNRATGYAHQYHLSLQHPLPGRTVLQASIIGNLGRKLPGANLSINQVPMEFLGPGATQALRPFPQFADVQVLAPSFGISSYHAGLLRLERRFAAGLQFSASYTWSKALSNVDGGEGAKSGSGSAYSNLYDRSADWGPADSDIRHRLTWSSTWDVPFGSGRRWLVSGPASWLAGGWSIGSIVTMQSAPPFTVTTQVNSTGAFSAGPLRANVLGDPDLPVDRRTSTQWFNTSMFTQPEPNTFGNQGVNILRADNLLNFDFAVIREFRVSEKVRTQFRGEIYNAFNHPNFGLPGSTLGAPGFGVMNETLPPRRVQVALRLTF